jgi:hypothetical protein
MITPCLGQFEVDFGLFHRIYAVKGKEISIFLRKICNQTFFRLHVIVMLSITFILTL